MKRNKINVAVCAVVVMLGFGACQTPQATVVKSDLKEKLLRGGLCAQGHARHTDVVETL